VLSTTDHNRAIAGLQYVYAVVSRRAGGVSVGINLNPNNACNWRCLYCQVPDLQRGTPPPINVAQLSAELHTLLGRILQGDFLAQEAPPEARHLVDVAFSGNGEPTLAESFPEAVAAVMQVLADFGLGADVRRILITNGSQIRRAGVQAGLASLAAAGGEAWFKLDSATEAGRLRVNDIALSDATVMANLVACAAIIPTWLQTCWFALDAQPPTVAEQTAYLALILRLQAAAIPLRGVQLYGLARPSFQAEAPRLSRLPEAVIQAFAARIQALGITVQVFP
jgi:hypothetical protein